MCGTSPTPDGGGSDDTARLDAERTAAARAVAQQVRDRVTARQLERYLSAPDVSEPPGS